jgi:signal transduction histidine kinase
MGDDLRPAREQTDEVLAEERAKADSALLVNAQEVERKAKVVLERAREEADEVLSSARDRADHKLEDLLDHPAPTQAVLDEERAREDEALRQERARADDAVQLARAATRARLFPMEREQTDLSLQIERARADSALANRDDFLGMVSHDLRNLLNGIVLSAGLVASNVQPDDERGKTTLLGTQRIERYASRMVRIIGDLVDISSIDAGKLAVATSKANARDLVVEAVETWSPHAAAKRTELKAGPTAAVSVSVDHDRILQVFGNLVTNAVKFSPEGTTIVVAAKLQDGNVCFSVADQGPGIPADQREAIFERFWQVGANDRRGLGLGLYISRCLVDAHGGRLWVESHDGAGSTFYFTVPAA